MLSAVKHPPIDPTDERILNMVEHAIDLARREPILHINPSKLGIQIDMPSYDGGKTLIVFENFMKDTLQYFMIYQLMSPKFEWQRICILGTTLKDDMDKWFWQTIDTQDALSVM